MCERGKGGNLQVFRSSISAPLRASFTLQHPAVLSCICAGGGTCKQCNSVAVCLISASVIWFCSLCSWPVQWLAWCCEKYCSHQYTVVISANVNHLFMCTVCYGGAVGTLEHYVMGCRCMFTAIYCSAL